MTDFTKQYTDLLIIQYYDKPNAFAEIEAQARTLELIKTAADQVIINYDLDLASGDMLDKIGKLVGLSRTEPEFNDDGLYRFFIGIKIAQNNASATMVSDDNDSIQDVVRQAFDNQAFVIDKKNMTLDLYITNNFDLDIVRLIFKLNILPKPQGVRYNNVKVVSNEPKFGFDNNTLSKGFASKFDTAYEGAPFDRKIIL